MISKTISQKQYAKLQKPIYKKTINIEEWTGQDSEISLGIGASVIDKMISYEVVGYDKNNKTYVANSLSWQDKNTNLDNGFRVVYHNDTDKMEFAGMGGFDWNDLESVIITVKYTTK